MIDLVVRIQGYEEVAELLRQAGEAFAQVKREADSLKGEADHDRR